jgi:hypothetical protein
MRISQAESERIVFERFVAAAQLRVVPGTVENRQPPEPDIRCEIEGQGLVGFELVEIIDSDFARLVSDQLSVERALEAGAGASPDLAAFSDALIYVRYLGDASARRRRDAIAPLFTFLRTLAAGFVGDIRVPADNALADVVRSIRVSRGDFSPGPHFQVEAVDFIDNPVVDRVSGKFKKRYATARRLELLAYYELHPVAPEAMWMSPVERCVQAELASSQFSRVWVFDVGQGRVLFRSDGSLDRTG